jgi:hypothetical protein
MRTNSTFHVNASCTVTSRILDVAGVGRTPYLEVHAADGYAKLVFVVSDPVFLDKLSNEADRLCREFVGDVPELNHMTGQFCECGECTGAEVAR